MAGWPPDRRHELLTRYCSAIDQPIPGQEPHHHPLPPPDPAFEAASIDRHHFTVASLLIGAAMDNCQPCQDLFTSRVLEGDRRVIGHLILAALHCTTGQPHAQGGPTLADSLNQAGRHGPDAAALLDAALAGDIAAVEHAVSALSEDTSTHVLHTALDTLVSTQPPTGQHL